MVKGNLAKRKQYFTGDLADGAVSENKLAADVRMKLNETGITNKYSETPQRVGTWIDGTPIWRWAFCRELSQSDKDSKSVYIPLPLNGNIGYTHGMVINSRAIATYDDYNIDEGVIMREYEPLYFKTDESLDEYSIIVGYIEFAANENDLKTD